MGDPGEVFQELESAEPLCTDVECSVCPDPERGLCSGAASALSARVEWALDSLMGDGDG